MVFVSHSSEDREFIESRIIDSFEQHGIVAWYSQDSIQFGEKWQPKLIAALEKCEWFIVILSEAAIASEWVQAEVKLAFTFLRDRERILLIKIDDSEAYRLDIRLPQRQGIDFQIDTGRGMMRLIEMLRQSQETNADSEFSIFSRELNAVDKIEEQVPVVFEALGSSSEEVRLYAQSFIEKLGWKNIARVIEDYSFTEKEDVVEKILIGLAALEAHYKVVELLEHIIPVLKNALRTRAILLLERKKLGLKREEIAGLFEEFKPSYKIEKTLGQGLFTASYLGFHRESRQKCVIRVLKPELANNAYLRSIFFDLVANARKYRSEHLVMCQDLGRITKPNAFYCYCIRDFVNAPTLQSALIKNIKYSQSQIIRIAEQILLALRAVHDHGETHGGVKPSNIFIEKKIILGDTSLPITLINDILLERLAYDYRYVAPEYFSINSTNNHIISNQSDFYSLGCVLYELAYGQPPFVANTPYELAALHLSDIAPQKPERKDLSEALFAFISLLLYRDPLRRPGSVEEIINLLNEIPEIDEQWKGLEVDSNDTFQQFTDVQYSVINLRKSVFDTKRTGIHKTGDKVAVAKDYLEDVSKPQVSIREQITEIFESPNALWESESGQKQVSKSNIPKKNYFITTVAAFSLMVILSLAILYYMNLPKIDCNAWLNRADQLLAAGFYVESVELIDTCFARDALRIPGESSHALETKAYALLAMRQNQEARGVILQLVNLDPEYKPDSLQSTKLFRDMVAEIKESR